MEIGILTITWNRLWYTYHCLKVLREKAGYDYKHVIVDNGSTDGTYEFLLEEGYKVIRNEENVGIVKAFYQGCDYLIKQDVDYIIKIDNDCEVITDGILKRVVDFLEENPKYIISPRILGLNRPPKTKERIAVCNKTFLNTRFIGGIFFPHPVKDIVPQTINDGRRLDDSVINPYYRRKGYQIGYIKEWKANHFETTNGQIERYGDRVWEYVK